MALRGAIYSDRGHLEMINMVTGGRDLLGSPQNSYWHRGRKFAAAMMAPAAVAQWEPFQAQEAKRLVVDLVGEPRKYVFWFDRYSTSVTVRECYGKTLRTPEETEWHVGKIMTRMHNIERVATPGGYLVEVIPALRYLPEFLAPFKREARALHEEESSYFYGLIADGRKDYENSVPQSPPSFVRCWAEKKDHWELSQSDIAYVIGTMYGGGAGTTSGAMQSFCQAMCHYPEWQTELHKELDRVVGPDRIPTFADEPELHLVRAVIKEVLRWRPVVPGSESSPFHSPPPQYFPRAPGHIQRC